MRFNPVLDHGTRPLLRTVMEVAADWALMSDGDSMVLWRMRPLETALLTVGAVVEDHGAGLCVIGGAAASYREADQEGDMPGWHETAPPAPARVPLRELATV